MALRAIGWYGIRIKLANGWQQAGYEDEEACWKALDVPRSVWYKYLRLCLATFSLSLEDLNQISIANLEMMAADIPDATRYDFDWVGDAKRLSPREFAQVITDRNVSAGSGSTPMDYVRFKVPFLAKTMIEETVSDFQKKYELASPGSALELLVADRFDRQSILGAVIAARAILRRMDLMLDNAGCFARDVRESVVEARDILGAACAKAIQDARQAESGQGRTGWSNRSAEQSSGASA